MTDNRTSEYAYCPIHGDLLAANRSYRCGNAPTGHEYSRHTIPLYGMLDLWMALYGTSHPQFDEFYEKHGYAETWARLLAEVRSRAAAGAAPQAESEAGKRLSSEFRADLVEAARERIQAVWADVPEGVDAKTLAQNVVSAQEFFWLSLHFPVQPSSTVGEAALIREAKAEAYEQGRIDQKRSAELYARYQRGELAEVEFERLMDTTNRRAAEYRKAVGS